MGTVSRDAYKPYQEVFSPRRSARLMKKDPHPIVKREPAVKCEGTSPWLQKGSNSGYIDSGEDPLVIARKGSLAKREVDYYDTPTGIVELNLEGIDIALERRVALFFQQAILCHNMSDFVFSARGADAQIGTSPSKRLSDGRGHYIIHKREAAHSSTIPTLFAHAKDGSTPDGIVYLKGGTSYYQHQATIGMHECVNGADELIDGNGSDGKLRQVTVNLLNRVADGLDPVEANKIFCRALKNEINKNIKLLRAGDNRLAVLESYRGKVQQIQRGLLNKELYDKLIGVVINPGNPHEKVLREEIYKKRYDVIRLQEVIESRIAKRIKNVKALLPRADKSLLEYVILKDFAGSTEKKIAEKLFGKTAAFFEEEHATPAALKTFRTRVENVRVRNRTQINNLTRDMRRDFKKLQRAEQTYRSGVFKSLRRKVNHWTQREFCTKYEQTTGAAVSQSWVSRMENLSRVPTKATYSTPITQRRRFVTIGDARRCAETFGVDSGVFFPALFTSQ